MSRISATTTLTYMPEPVPGERGSRGPALRVQLWDALPDGFQFFCGAEGEMYIDVVVFRGGFYACKVSHEKAMLNAPIIGNGIHSAKWTGTTPFQILATHILLADNAYIKLGQSNEILILDPDTDKVIAAFSGYGQYPLFLGADSPEASNFRVSREGKAYMYEAEIFGMLISGVADGKRIEVNPDSGAIYVYDASGALVNTFSGDSYSTPEDIFGSPNTAAPVIHSATGTITVSSVGGTNESAVSSRKLASVSTTKAAVTTVAITLDMSHIAPVAGVVCSGSAWVYLRSYATSAKGTPILTTVIGHIEDDGKAVGSLYSMPSAVIRRSVHIPAGYHELSVEWELSASGEGGNVSFSWKDTSLSLFGAAMAARYFSNGFSLGTAANNCMMVWRDAAGNMAVRHVRANGIGLENSASGFRWTPDGGAHWVAVPLLMGRVRVAFTATNTYAISSQSSANGGTVTVAAGAKNGVAKLTVPAAWGLTVANASVHIIPIGSNGNFLSGSVYSLDLTGSSPAVQVAFHTGNDARYGELIVEFWKV